MKAIISTLVASTVAFGVTAAAPVTIAAANWQTVNSTATGDQDGAAIAANRNGYVAVVWEDDRDSTDPGNNNHSEIYIRVFKNGTHVYEKKVSGGGTAGTNWRHVSPDVGLDDDGNAVVAWADDPDGNGVYNIPFHVYSPTGALRTSGRANESAAGTQLDPSVAVDPDGAPTSGGVEFAIVWEDIQGTNPPDIKAAGYTNTITKLYEKVVSPSGGTHRNPDVALKADGDATVVWEDDADGNGYYQIALTRMSKWGTVTLSRRSANSNGGGQQTAPAIASTFNGEFAVTWISDHTGTAGIWTRSFDAVANPLHDDIEVVAGGLRPDIGIDEQGGTVVGWTAQATDLDTWVRGFNPDGSTTGRLASQQLMRVSAGRQDGMVVAVSAYGEVSIAYADDNDGNDWDQVYLGQGITNSSW